MTHLGKVAPELVLVGMDGQPPPGGGVAAPRGRSGVVSVPVCVGWAFDCRRRRGCKSARAEHGGQGRREQRTAIRGDRDSVVLRAVDRAAYRFGFTRWVSALPATDFCSRR